MLLSYVPRAVSLAHRAGIQLTCIGMTMDVAFIPLPLPLLHSHDLCTSCTCSVHGKSSDAPRHVAVLLLPGVAPEDGGRCTGIITSSWATYLSVSLARSAVDTLTCIAMTMYVPLLLPLHAP